MKIHCHSDGRCRSRGAELLYFAARGPFDSTVSYWTISCVQGLLVPQTYKDSHERIRVTGYSLGRDAQIWVKDIALENVGELHVLFVS